MAQKQILPQPVLTHPLTREGLNLTPTQVTSIQSLFQGANRLSRLDKATILSFVSGNGGKLIGTAESTLPHWFTASHTLLQTFFSESPT